MLIAALNIVLWTVAAALLVYIVIYAFEAITGKSIPEKIKQLLWLIVAIIVVIKVLQVLLGPSLLI